MPVELMKEGEPIPEGGVRVETSFAPLDAVSVFFSPQAAAGPLGEPLKEKAFMVVRNAGDPTLPNNKTIMEMTHARSVNLWYEINTESNESMHLVQDAEILQQLEESLHIYEDHRHEQLN